MVNVSKILNNVNSYVSSLIPGAWMSLEEDIIYRNFYVPCEYKNRYVYANPIDKSYI